MIFCTEPETPIETNYIIARFFVYLLHYHAKSIRLFFLLLLLFTLQTLSVFSTLILLERSSAMQM